MPVSTPSSPNAAPTDVDRILKLKVPVIVRLARRKMPVAEIMQMTHGSILEFNQPADTPLELLVNNQTIGTGEAVKVGEKFGLRVRHIGNLRDRLDAMRG
ncbi:MAG: FliM/FliN family flagellar motor switch protein [Planctomycetota bacterium]